MTTTTKANDLPVGTVITMTFDTFRKTTDGWRSDRRPTYAGSDLPLKVDPALIDDLLNEPGVVTDVSSPIIAADVVPGATFTILDIFTHEPSTLLPGVWTVTGRKSGDAVLAQEGRESPITVSFGLLRRASEIGA